MSDVQVLLDYPEVLQAIEKAQLEAMKLDIEDAFQICALAKIELEKIGWTCDYDMSGELFDLEKLEK